MNYGICQKNTTEPLNCPLHNPIASGDQTGSYETFLADVGQFQAINAFPNSHLFQPDESAQRFAMHNVSWNKSCYLKYNISKLAKAKRRSAWSEDDPVRTGLAPAKNR